MFLPQRQVFFEAVWYACTIVLHIILHIPNHTPLCRNRPRPLILAKDQLLQIRNDLQVVTDCVIEHAIPIYDWNPTNILVLRKHDQCAIKIADLEGEFGNKEFIKISRWNTFARRRKLRRRIDRFYAHFNNTILKQST